MKKTIKTNILAQERKWFWSETCRISVGLVDTPGPTIKPLPPKVRKFLTFGGAFYNDHNSVLEERKNKLFYVLIGYLFFVMTL